MTKNVHAIPSSLRIPLHSTFPVTFDFGAIPESKELIQAYAVWGLKGHNALDFGCPEQTPIFACDSGSVVQSGVNGDFGISVIIQHSWGKSMYAHLSSTKVTIDDTLTKGDLIGFSGSTGFSYGPHLHFAIQPNNPDLHNGYLGYIDPKPYLKLKKKKNRKNQQ